MTEAGNVLSDATVKKIKDLIAAHENRNLSFNPTGRDNLPDVPPPIRFITHKPYSTYAVRSYSSSELAEDGSERTGQEYLMMVDGEGPQPVSLMYYDPDGNHKQMIQFAGDSISGELNLVLEGETTSLITLDSTLTEQALKDNLEALPNIGKKNILVSIWPGRWLIEFVGKLSGKSFEPFEFIMPEYAVFEAHAYETLWADSLFDNEVIYPIPVGGKWDSDDGKINDSIAAGSFGTAKLIPGVGYVVDAIECRDFNGYGTPLL